MHAPYPGQLVITDDDRGPVANLGAWLGMCCMIMCVLSKIVTKGLCIGYLQKDDLLISLAMLSGCCQVVTVSLQVKYGLGRRLPDTVDLTRLQQSVLASEVFYILTLALAQMSILQYMTCLSRDSRRRSSVRYLSVFTAVWALAGFLSVVFQCRPPSVSVIFGDQCFDRTTFWTIWTVISAILDTAIGLLPVFLLYEIHVRRTVKVGVLSAFAARILGLPILVFRLVYIHRVREGDDPAYGMLNIMLLTTVHMNASILFTCLPFLKPVLDGLQSGIWAGELRSNSVGHAISSIISSVGRRTKKHPYSTIKVTDKRHQPSAVTPYASKARKPQDG